MKLNFSLHLCHLTCGIIILCSLVFLIYVIEDNTSESILTEYLEEEGTIGITALFLIFLSYGAGIIMETLFAPYKQTKSLSNQLKEFIKILPQNDFIKINAASSSCNNNNVALTDTDIYKYMQSYIIHKSENLSRNIQTIYFKTLIIKSIMISTIIIIFTIIIDSIYNKYEESASIYIYITLFIIFIILLYANYKNKMELSKATERAYYILRSTIYTQCPSTQKDDQLEIEL